MESASKEQLIHQTLLLIDPLEGGIDSASATDSLLLLRHKLCMNNTAGLLSLLSALCAHTS